MGDISVNDMAKLNPTGYRIHDRAHLWDHPLSNYSRADQFPGLGCLQSPIYLSSGSIHDPFHIGHIDQLVGIQGNCYLACCRVSIDIQVLPVAIDGDGGDHRDILVIEKGVQHRGIDLLNLTDMPEIDLLLSPVNPYLLGGHLSGYDQVTIFSRYTNRFSTAFCNQGYNIAVDLSNKDHLLQSQASLHR